MKKKTAVIAICALGLCALIAGGVAVERHMTAKDRLEKLSSVYQSALLSSLARMEDAQLNLSKALLSQDEGQSAQLLSSVSSSAEGVRSSLSLIPLSHSATRSAVKFANQLADYAQTLLGQGMTEGDGETLAQLITTCQEVTAALKGALGEAGGGADGPSAYWQDGDVKARPLERVGDESAVSYPTLIYDGPFSDARETGTPKQLGAQVITRQEAEEIARQFVGPERATAVRGGTDSGGVMPCYGVTVTAGDVDLQVAVTKTGGKVLWMSPETADFEPLKSVEECKAEAESFLTQRGFGDVEATFFQVYDGVAVINYAPVQGETLLYPDLVKVQLRLDTAQVVGVECNHYLMNHTARSLKPEKSLEECQGAVSARLNIEKSRLCLIPLGGGEELCYEFRGSFQNHAYLVYISAVSGEQVEILKIVESDTGLLTA